MRLHSYRVRMIMRISEHLARLTVAEAWARIDEWVATSYPELADRLAGPATNEEIARLELALGARLPDDYKASLGIHAGGRSRPTRRGDSLYAMTPFAEFCLLPPDVLLQRRTWLQSYCSIPSDPHARVAPTVKRAYYDPGWVPVVAADEDRAIFYCIDTAPTEPAARGQIVQMITSADPDRDVLWPSFRECLIGGLLQRIEQEAVDPEMIKDGIVRFIGDG